MPTQKLQDYLDRHEIQYVTISHSPAYTAQRIAELTRIPGKELAKTVIVKIDDKFAMAVLPASRRVNLRHLQESTVPCRHSVISTTWAFTSPSS
jgi:Ala-tRNA(Pro) deacylase